MANKFDYSTPYPGSTSGVRGVSYVPDRKKWDAKISYKGKRIRLGHFDTLEEAAAAYRHAADKIVYEMQKREEVGLAMVERKVQSLFD